MENQKVIPRKQKVTTKLNEFRRTIASFLTPAIVRLLSRTGIAPNTITVFGFLVTLGAAALILTGNQFAAGFVVIAAGFFDMLDGSLARNTNQVTRFGGILDSTLDRLSEAALLVSILVVFGINGSIPGIWITSIALVSSMMVSYIRSRAESAGIDCEVGIFTRPERIIVLSIGLLLSGFDNALLITLGIVSLFSVITIIQRLLHAWKLTSK
ncbi:MAG: CDP-alcohol phosphatidyltransferase family protein [Dehalococcoidales bacterium]|nr:CDP-alcohol phosphatidyltransferase family protein [Dehalococcoidales bacterium]